MSCADAKIKQFTKVKLLSNVNADSLVCNEVENYCIDKSEDSTGSLYKFNKSGNLIFYCFLNKQSYGFAEHYNEMGNRIKIEGYPFVQVRTSTSKDSMITLSFLYSTLRKSNYKIITYTSFGDTLINYLSKANIYSNTGFFNIAIRTFGLAEKAKIINKVFYFDSIDNKLHSFSDTVFVKDIL